VLAVVGAGHLAGLARYLETDTEAPAPLRAELEAVPKKRNIPWFTLGILAIVATGIGVGFYRGGLGVGTDCWRPGRCIPAAWRAWAACWPAVTR
jgi:pheromone shutdown protein TraB